MAAHTAQAITHPPKPLPEVIPVAGRGWHAFVTRMARWSWILPRFVIRLPNSPRLDRVDLRANGCRRPLIGLTAARDSITVLVSGATVTGSVATVRRCPTRHTRQSV